MSKPVEIEFLMKDGLSAGIDKVGEKTEALGDKAAKAGTEYQKAQQQVMELRNVISLLEAQLNELHFAGDVASPDLDQSENIAQIEALEKQVDALKSELIRLQSVASDTDVIPPQLPQAERKINGLHNSIQQMAREMPSLAMGPQTFFMAISNNLPIFTDEVTRARKEYNNLIQTGQKATPVWKQILSSLFSWQTALTTGIMLLVMYGDEIVDWVGSLFKGEKQLTATERAQRGLNEAIKENGYGIGDKVLLVKKLSDEWASLGGNLEEQERFIKDSREEFEKLGVAVTDVTDVENLLVTNTPEFIEAMRLRAEAAAAQKLAIEKYEQGLKKERELETIDSTITTYVATKWGFQGQATEWSAVTSDNPEYLRVKNEIKEAFEDADAYFNKNQELENKAKDKLKEAGIDEYNPDAEAEAKRKAEEAKRLAKQQKDLENRLAEELRQQKWDNEQAEIDQMKDGSEKRIRQIQLDYDKAIAEIEEQEARWQEAQGGELTKKQQTEIDKAKKLAKDKKEQDEELVKEEEIRKHREKLNVLLDEFKTYDQRRRDIDEAYNRDMAIYNAELEELRNTGGDTSLIEASIQARTDAYKADIQSLEADILHSTDFYDKLFSEISQKGYKVLKNFYKEAKHVLDDAKVDAEGVEIEIPVKDPEGNIIKKKVRVTIAEFDRMKQQVEKINDELEKKNPFSAFKNSFSDLTSAIKNEGDVSGALNAMKSAGNELLTTVQGWGENLNTIFGESYGEAIDEIGQAVSGIMDMGVGVGQLFSGDIVGGITNILSGIVSIVELEEKAKQRLVEIEMINIRINRAVRERNEELVQQLDTIHNIIQEQEILNWLVEKGFAKPNSVSVWDANSAALEEYKNNLKNEIEVYDELLQQLYGSTATVGGYDGCLSWSWETFSLVGKSAEEIKALYESGALSEETMKIYEAWVESGESVEELKKNLEETYATLQEMVMGNSFDGFLNNVANVLREARGDVSRFSKFTEETIAEALFNSFKYQYLAEALRPFYDELSGVFINGTATEDYLDEWKRRFEETMKDSADRLEAMEQVAGIESSLSGGVSQTGKSGAFTAMNQEQGTKLEGLFVSGQMHWASIDEYSEDVSKSMRVAENHLAKIEENTGDCAKELKEVKEEIKKLNRDGLKVK